jgi:hypothetical protein
MKNLVCTSHAKERLEIARRHSILHLERIVGKLSGFRRGIRVAKSAFLQKFRPSPPGRYESDRRMDNFRLSYDSDAIGSTLLRRSARGLSTVYLGCVMVGASLWRLIARGGGFGHD